MKKTHSRIMLLAATALALLLSFNGGAEQKNAQRDAQQEGTIQNDPQARGEVMQCCTDIFGSEEETGAYHIRVIDELDGGRVDEYDGARGADEWGYDNSPLYALTEPSMYGTEPWCAATEQDWEACRNGIVAEISHGANTIAFIPPWGAMKTYADREAECEHPGGNVLRLTRNGEITYYKSSTAHVAQLLFGYAQGAVMGKLYELHVDGAETDYEAVANEFCAQFAANLNAAPRWFSGKPDDAAAPVKERVIDAYYGTDYPNFCFSFGVMMRFDELESSQRYNWEAGSGMVEPAGEGEYGDYFSWGMAADACRDEAGDWYIDGTWTGGGAVWLPYIGRSWSLDQQEATASQLAECWFLSSGESHEWRLPNLIYDRPGAEVREMLAALEPDQAAELETGLRAVWDNPIYAGSFPGGFDAKLNGD